MVIKGDTTVSVWTLAHIFCMPTGMRGYLGEEQPKQVLTG